MSLKPRSLSNGVMTDFFIYFTATQFKRMPLSVFTFIFCEFCLKMYFCIYLFICHPNLIFFGKSVVLVKHLNGVLFFKTFYTHLLYILLIMYRRREMSTPCGRHIVKGERVIFVTLAFRTQVVRRKKVFNIA